MQVLGIVGGIASGKTLVSEVFAELGAVVLSGDRIAHEVLREPAVLATVRDRWGDLVLDEKGQVDRSQLAAIVFGETISGSARHSTNCGRKRTGSSCSTSPCS